MALKTLDPAVKAAFTNAGIKLTPKAEHVAAEAQAKGAIDWTKVIQIGVNLALQILGLFGIVINPAPASSVKQSMPSPKTCPNPSDGCGCCHCAQKNILLAALCCECHCSQGDQCDTQCCCQDTMVYLAQAMECCAAHCCCC